ncbi:MAG: hypothetical protein HYY84_01925 [Deltaproteobacteria bacterium]|nr:hypothetical protein [Deltaproteobacteria bacterium]
MRKAIQSVVLAGVMGASGAAFAGLTPDDVRKNVERFDKAKVGIGTFSVPEVLNEVAAITDYFFLQKADVVSGFSKMMGIDISAATVLSVSDRGEIVVRGGKILAGVFKGTRDYNGVKIHGNFEGSEEVAYGDFAAEWGGAAMRTRSLSALKRAIDGKTKLKRAMTRKPEVKELIEKAFQSATGDVQVLLTDRMFRELEGLVGERPRGAVINAAFPDGKVKLDARIFMSDSGATKLAEVLESVTTKLAGHFVGEALDNLQGSSSQMAGILTLFRGPIQKLVSVMRDLKVKVEPGAAVMNLTVDRRTLHALIIAGGVVSAGLFMMREKAVGELKSERRERSVPKAMPVPVPPADSRPGEVVTPSTKDGPEKP